MCIRKKTLGIIRQSTLSRLRVPAAAILFCCHLRNRTIKNIFGNRIHDVISGLRMPCVDGGYRENELDMPHIRISIGSVASASVKNPLLR